MKIPWKRDPTKKENQKETGEQILRMITTYGEHFYSWNGKMYESDIVRSCIRPKAKAISRLVGKHIRDDPKGGLMVNPEASIRFLLSEPNPYMTASQMQEKVANQLCLNNNAFILIVRDENGCPIQLYPIPCVLVETRYNKDGYLFLRFQYQNGKTGTFPYADIIHLRQDYSENDLFGNSPAPALAPLMEVMGTIDQGIIKAIKNSGIVRWLLKFTSSMREEDVKRSVKQFVDNYLAVETDTFGAAGVDAKADVQRIEPKDYVPNAAQTDRIIKRVHSLFGTNEKIIQSLYTEDEWNAYYEAEIEPVIAQMQQAYTIRIFSRKARGFGNRIVFESNNLQCANLTTKLAFQAMVDRGAMTPNEWREIMNMAPVPGGDEPIRRLDTQVVNMVRTVLEQAGTENWTECIGTVNKLLDAWRGEKSETQN